jgi:hypothetical protein
MLLSSRATRGLKQAARYFIHKPSSWKDNNGILSSKSSSLSPFEPVTSILHGLKFLMDVLESVDIVFTDIPAFFPEAFFEFIQLLFQVNNRIYG